MAVVFIKKPILPEAEKTAPPQSIAEDIPPWEVAVPESKKETLLEALHKFDKGGSVKLYILNKATSAEFQVLDWDPDRHRAIMVGEHGLRINPVVGERENNLYQPLWR